MRLRTPLNLWCATLFTTLGLSPLVACGGTTVGTRQERNDAGGKGGSPLPCKNPTPVLGPNGAPTGFVACDGGAKHRPSKLDCPNSPPRAATCPAPTRVDGGPTTLSECVTDSDCNARALGYCVAPALGPGASPECYCSYGCVRDEDCGAGNICVCGDPVGYCEAALDCVTDRDCNGGLCLSTPDGRASPPTFLCQTPNDTCVTDSDCASLGGQCRSGPFFGPPLVDRFHQCGGPDCSVGRPFLVGGAARVAGPVRREDWTSALAPSLDGIGPSARDSLAGHWTEIALMEHASIAAFARFALELMSLGAPPTLLVATHEAMADETVHARDAFALASAYAGEPIGPGKLDVDAALGSRSPLDMVRTTILEGCIGETVAAVEAAEALAHATDPAVRNALARVTVDEARHSELAWRFVQWVLDHGDATLRSEAATLLVGIVETENAACDALDDTARRPDPQLSAHGFVSRVARSEIRRRVLADIVLPCARALVSRSGRFSAEILRQASLSVLAVTTRVSRAAPRPPPSDPSTEGDRASCRSWMP